MISAFYDVRQFLIAKVQAYARREGKEFRKY